MYDIHICIIFSDIEWEISEELGLRSFKCLSIRVGTILRVTNILTAILILTVVIISGFIPVCLYIEMKKISKYLKLNRVTRPAC